MSNQESNRQRMDAFTCGRLRCRDRDDFGTGYSALSYLRSFRSMVKIDVPLCSIRLKTGCLLLDGIINLVNNLGMTPIIEGVEPTISWTI